MSCAARALCIYSLESTALRQMASDQRSDRESSIRSGIQYASIMRRSNLDQPIEAERCNITMYYHAIRWRALLLLHDGMLKLDFECIVLVANLPITNRSDSTLARIGWYRSRCEGVRARISASMLSSARCASRWCAVCAVELYSGRAECDVRDTGPIAMHGSKLVITIPLFIWLKMAVTSRYYSDRCTQIEVGQINECTRRRTRIR